MIEMIRRLPLGIGIIIALVMWGAPVLYAMIADPKFIPHCLFVSSLSAAAWLIFFISLERKN